MNVYNLVIALSCVIIFSHLFNILSKRTNIPSVILLILLGIGIKYGLDAYGINQDKLIFSTLELLGIVGLIMIVLEAALDLELSKEKWPIIWKSFAVALISLGGCAFLISVIINHFYQETPLISLVYAIPLSVVSSAIVIPSVSSLVKVRNYRQHHYNYHYLIRFQLWFSGVVSANRRRGKALFIDCYVDFDLCHW